MGCLNSKGQFNHWFSNIHLSGPCNRSCYFCIGQHMMALDSLDVLDTWPLPNIEQFVDKLVEKGISEVNVTGSNTDPLLYRHLPNLKDYLLKRIPNLVFGVRTNGVAIKSRTERWKLFDKGSISVTSLDNNIYRKTMGNGRPPNLRLIKALCDSGVGPAWNKVKFNIVLCPEILEWYWAGDHFDTFDLYETLMTLVDLGVTTVNLREPYGQPYLGDKLEKICVKHKPKSFTPTNDILGNKSWWFLDKMRVTYWNVHYTEVESVNLYANGVISETYPVTEGHDPVNGIVQGQEHFTTSGRIRPQWLTIKGNNV